MGTHTAENRIRMPLTARGHAVLGTDFTVQGWSHPLPYIHVLFSTEAFQLVHSGQNICAYMHARIHLEIDKQCVCPFYRMQSGVSTCGWNLRATDSTSTGADYMLSQKLTQATFIVVSPAVCRAEALEICSMLPYIEVESIFHC